MGFFYTTDIAADNDTRILYISLVTFIPVLLLTIQLYILSHRNDDFMKFRYYLSTCLIVWCLYLSMLEGALTNNKINDYPSLCNYTNGRIRFTEICILLPLTILIGNATKLTYLSFKQYWATQRNIKVISQRVLRTERLIKWLISKPWFIMSFQICYFNIYFVPRLLIESNCNTQDNVSYIVLPIGIIILLFLAWNIKAYGTKDTFNVRNELLQAAIYMTVMLFIAFVIILIFGDITVNAGITPVFYCVLYSGTIFNTYYRSVVYVWKKTHPYAAVRSSVNNQQTEHSKTVIRPVDNRISVIQSISPTLVTFDFMMETTILKNAFRKHLISEFSCENLMFVEDAIAFRNMKDGNIAGDQLGFQARHIYNTYIVDGSNMQVNISAIQRMQIEELFKREDITANIFNVAVKEVTALMNNDSWTRFIASSGAKSACQEILVPQQETKTPEPKKNSGWINDNKSSLVPIKPNNILIITPFCVNIGSVTQ